MQQLTSGLWVEEDISRNGTSPDELAMLEEHVTRGYKPTIPVEGMYNAEGWPVLTLRRDTEIMITHPTVRQALRYFCGGISGAEFWGGANSENPEDEMGLQISQDIRVANFVKEQCERFWDRGVPRIQIFGYQYGWCGSENVYSDEDGVLKWDILHTFAPMDTYLLTEDFEPVGVRIKSVRGKPGPVDLWMAGYDTPAKGMWYVHNPRYHPYYGESQLIGAWRPWRRLAYKDGAETTLDGAMYRYGYQGVLMRYPNEDLLGPAGVPNTTQNSQGQPMRYARDMARQIGEQAKAGATVGLPSTRDKDGNYKWDMVWPTSMIQGLGAFIDACKYLQDQITSGIGVPPELLEAADSGSGYSGRRIPLEAFLATQQQIADAMLKLFIDQVLKPLVRWNFGDAARFTVQVKPLIKTRTRQAQAGVNQSGTQQPQSGQPNNAHYQPQPEPKPVQPKQMFSQEHPIITDRMRELAKKISRAA